MAVAYHSCSKRKLLADLVELAFANTLQGIVEEGASAKARSILSTYYHRALPNADLLRAVLDDFTLISKDLIDVTDKLRAGTREVDDGDANDVLYLWFTKPTTTKVWFCWLLSFFDTRYVPRSVISSCKL